jgi:hypothetical protein
MNLLFVQKVLLDLNYGLCNWAFAEWLGLKLSSPAVGPKTDFSDSEPFKYFVGHSVVSIFQNTRMHIKSTTAMLSSSLKLYSRRDSNPGS